MATIGTKLGEVISKVAETVQGKETAPLLTTATGCPLANNKNSLTVGPHGPVVLEDRFLIEKLQHFAREKIPARNVHALGTGCYGKLIITNDITKYTKAAIFNKVGKETRFFARLSGTFIEQGEPETARDIRGFAMKFYTEEGNWDLMTINVPVFNARDMKQGPDGVHASKRDPRTGMWNPVQMWDFFNTHPEALHFAMHFFSDRGGTPLSYRFLHWFGCNTYSFVNAQNERFWIKFHVVSPGGAKGLTADQAKLLAGEEPEFLSRDLHSSIEKGNFPTWKLCVQIMPEAEGYKNPVAFDPTKIWKHDQFPLIEVGTIELNRNITNYFSEVEQVAFSPANVIPGISFSPDKLLQGRLFVYDDTQNHRIGSNYKQLPINCPLGFHTQYYGGSHNLEVVDKFPHYAPSNFGGYPMPDPAYREPAMKVDGPVDYYDFPYEGTDQDYFAQCTDYWNLMSDMDKRHLCENIALSLQKVPKLIMDKLLLQFDKIHGDFANGVRNLLTARSTGTIKKTEAENLIESINITLRVK